MARCGFWLYDGSIMDTQQATIITGGGKGIGKAIALRMAGTTNIVIVGRNEEELVATKREIEDMGGTAEYVVGDVADPATATKTMVRIQEKGWTVTNLVCNAGTGKGGPTATLDPHLWHEIMEVNVDGSLYFIQACIPGMLEQKHGVICIMGSMASVRGYKNNAAYVASKHALLGLARTLAVEYGKHGIVTVPLCPGFVMTEMTERSIRGLMKRKKISFEEAEKIIAGVNPQRRIIPPEEVAEMVMFGCENKVPSLSGSPLILSGGE